jgi:hypothetical protein
MHPMTRRGAFRPNGLPETDAASRVSSAATGAAVGGFLKSPPLRKLHDYWCGRRHGDRLPGRADIDPVDMAYILGYLILFDVQANPLQFRYRLAGSRLTATMGFDPTGMLLDEHPHPSFRPMARQLLTDVATTALPHAVYRDTFIDGRLRRYELAALPLAADGATVDMILTGTWFR